MTCCDGGSKGVNPGGNFRLKEVSRWAFGLFHYFFKNFKIFSYFLEFSKFCTNFLQFIIIIRNYQTLYGGILRNEGKKLIQIITLRFSTTVTPSIIYILQNRHLLSIYYKIYFLHSFHCNLFLKDCLVGRLQ